MTRTSTTGSRPSGPAVHSSSRPARVPPASVHRHRRRVHATAGGAVAALLVATPVAALVTDDDRPDVPNVADSGAPTLSPSPSPTAGPAATPTGTPTRPDGRISAAQLGRATLNVQGWIIDDCPSGRLAFKDGEYRTERDGNAERGDHRRRRARRPRRRRRRRDGRAAAVLVLRVGRTHGGRVGPRCAGPDRDDGPDRSSAATATSRGSTRSGRAPPGSRRTWSTSTRI